MQAASPTTTVNPLAEALVAADGNPNLAAERMGYGRDVSRYITELASDPTAYTMLQPMLRTLMMIKLTDLINQVALTVVSGLADLEPYEASKTLTTLLAQLGEVTSAKQQAPQTNINIAEAIFDIMPTNVKQALVKLMPAPQSTGESTDAA